MGNFEVFSERLAQLLERSSITPEEFIDQLGLEPSITVRDILDGTHVLEPSDIVAAADVLQVPIPVLTGDVPVAGHLGVSLRLGLVGDRADTPNDALGYADRMLSHQALLDDLLGSVAAAQKVPMSTNRYGINAGRASADRVRRLCGLAGGPITDLVGLVESFGFPVLFRMLPEGLHGFNVRDERGGHPKRMIVISTRGGWPLQRYTLAHELCHALYDDAGQVIFDHLDEPDVIEEVRAEAFARELLLPRQALDAELRTRRIGPGSTAEVWSRAVPELMLRWGVSRQALVRSLVNDGHATEGALSIVRRTSVHELLERSGLREPWEQMCGPEHQESGSPMLVARAIEAFGRGLVSLRFVAEAVDEDVAETERLLVEAGWLRPVAV